MTATDRLRALLDERVVEYETDDHMGYSETRWDDACAFQLAPGAGLVMAVTPEQAVKATLGRDQPPYDKLVEVLRRDWDIECSWDGLRRFWYVGLTDEGMCKRDEREAARAHETCQMTEVFCGTASGVEWVCSACGSTCFVSEPMDADEKPNYCPSCGRKVVE